MSMRPGILPMLLYCGQRATITLWLCGGAVSSPTRERVDVGHLLCHVCLSGFEAAQSNSVATQYPCVVYSVLTWRKAKLTAPVWAWHARGVVLSAGVNLDPASGALTGTPTLPSDASVVTFAAENAAGRSSEVAVTITALAPGAPSITAGLVISSIDDHRAANAAFVDAHITALESLDRIESLLQTAEALATQATDEHFIRPIRDHVAHISRCNTAIMTELAHDSPKFGTIDEQVQQRESIVAQLYSGVAERREQLITISADCTARAAEVLSASDSMGGGATQVASEHRASSASLIQAAKELITQANRIHAPADALVDSTAALIRDALLAATATTLAIGSRDAGGVCTMFTTASACKCGSCIAIWE